MKEKLLKGCDAAGKAFKVHLDGYNMMPFWKGENQSPRHEFFYLTDDGTSPIAATTAGSWCSLSNVLTGWMCGGTSPVHKVSTSFKRKCKQITTCKTLLQLWRNLTESPQ